MKTRYLIFGNGYFGNKFKRSLGNSEISELRVKDEKGVISEIRRHDPEFVINCIGKTGVPNVDWCETHESETLHANLIVPGLLAVACQKTGKFLVHLGSGCIYEGDNSGMGFTEEDLPNFDGSFYSRTKKMSEDMLRNFPVLQLRIRIPFDDAPHPKNAITKLLGFDKILVERNSMTYIQDFLQASKKLMDDKRTGVFNVVSKGGITYREILAIYKELDGSKSGHQEISASQLDSICLARRSNCVLSTKKLEGVVGHIESIDLTVRTCLEKYIQNEGRHNLR